MYNHFCETTHDKKTSYKKSKLIIIFSLLGLMALPTHGVAGNLPFDKRKPVENKVKCGEKMISALRPNNTDNELAWHLITEGCYSALNDFLESRYDTISYNHHPEPPPAIDPKLGASFGMMGTLLSNTRNNVIEQYNSAYWNVFDLLFAYTDIKRYEHFFRLLRHSSGGLRFSPEEALYLTGRFLSREDTVRKLMLNSRSDHPIHSLDFPNAPQLSLLVPFGLPLTLLDMLQLSLLVDYDNLEPAQQQELARGSLAFKSDFESTTEELQKSLGEKLGNRSFINDHKAAHSYLIARLSQSAVKNKATIQRGAIQVLTSSNAGATPPPRKKAKKGGKKGAGTSSSVFMYSVITMDMLREALRRGLNPNTLISGIEFNFGTLDRVMSLPVWSRQRKIPGSLLEWAAMGNIAGAGPEDAVTMLIKAGANPHALPEEGNWSKVKQKWLKTLQHKVDALGLPCEGRKHALHDYMLYDPKMPEARFMNNAQGHLHAEVSGRPRTQIGIYKP